MSSPTAINVPFPYLDQDPVYLHVHKLIKDAIHFYPEDQHLLAVNLTLLIERQKATRPYVATNPERLLLVVCRNNHAGYHPGPYMALVFSHFRAGDVEVLVRAEPTTRRDREAVFEEFRKAAERQLELVL